MATPKEILAVKRPKNTIVTAYGKDKNLYAVRERIGCKYVDGRRIPVNGPTIGHIIDGKYVPMEEEKTPDISSSPIDLKDWAGAVLCDRLFKDILDELLEVYSKDDAMKIYCIAILRVCFKDIKDNELKEAYEKMISYQSVGNNTALLTDFDATMIKYTRSISGMTSGVL
jgi:hypothetical protein